MENHNEVSRIEEESSTHQPLLHTEDGNIFLPVERNIQTLSQVEEECQQMLTPDMAHAITETLDADTHTFRIKEIILFIIAITIGLFLVWALPGRFIPAIENAQKLPSYRAIYTTLYNGEYTKMQRYELEDQIQEARQRLLKTPEDISLDIQYLIALWMLKGHESQGVFGDNKEDKGVIDREYAYELFIKNPNLPIDASNAIIYMIDIITNDKNWNSLGGNQCYFNKQYFSFKKDIRLIRTEIEKEKLKKVRP